MACKCEKNGLNKEECSMYIDYPEDDNCCLNSIEKNGPMTQEEIAKRLGLTKTRINQIEKMAMEKISKRARNRKLDEHF